MPKEKVEGKIRKEKEAEPIEIDPKVMMQLKIIAQRVGGDYGLQVALGQPGQGSVFNGAENKITLDPLHVAKDPDMAKFVAAHEGSHRANTRGLHQMDMKEEVIEKLEYKIGLAYGLNCAEDPAVNNWFVKKFRGLKRVKDKTYDEQFAQEGNAMGLEHPEVQTAMSMIGRVPKFVYFGGELIRLWHTGKFSESLDEELKEPLNNVAEAAQKYFEDIPSVKADEAEISQKAKERFLNFYENIWPEMKKIVDQDLSDEQIKQMLNDQREQVKEALRELSKEIQEAMKQMQQQGQEKMQQQKEQMQQGMEGAQGQLEQIEKEIDKLKEKDKSASGQKKEDIKKEIDDKKDQAEKLKKQIEEIKKSLDQLKEQKEKGNSPLPVGKLSKEEKEALKKALDRLPDDIKKELENKAKEALGGLEDKLNKDIQGKLSQDNIKSHQEQKDEQRKKQQQAEKKEEEAQERKKEAEALKKARAKYQEKLRDNMTEYEQVLADVRPIIEKTYIKLKKIFEPFESEWQPGYPYGQRIDKKKAMQAKRNPILKRRMWERKKAQEALDYRFCILMDTSGSMVNGNKMEPTFKGVVVLAEVLKKLKIPFEIIGFSNEFETFKGFDDQLDRDRLTELTTYKLDSTKTHPVTEFAWQELKKQLADHSFLITLTDGMPDRDNREPLKETLQKIKQEGKISLVGIGLGEGGSYVDEYYPAGFHLDEFPLSAESKRAGKKDFDYLIAKTIEDLIAKAINK